jgi:hypothetical protein
MRIARKLAVLCLLLLAPFAATVAAQDNQGSVCGDCSCSAGQCCTKGAWGSCSCHKCG